MRPGRLNRKRSWSFSRRFASSGIPLAELPGPSPIGHLDRASTKHSSSTRRRRNALVAADPACAEIIRPYLRGQDIKRWHPDWAGLWMIILKSSGDHAWPWSAAGDASAEDIFRDTYPSLYARMKPMQEALTKRQDKGRYWWELRSCAYWQEFEKPKLVYQEIQFHPSYTLDSAGHYGNNKTFFIPSATFIS